ncbi:MAG: caspase family protein [Elusimicrobia bacterium]|nr:caspase family protein [Elusimicrobiota bacterium]
MPTCRRLVACASISAVLLAAAPLLRAKDISVRADGTGDFKSIQAAIDAAEEGDAIRIASGTYAEHISINGKNGLSLIGEGSASIETDDPTATVLAVENAKKLLLQGLRGVHTSPGCSNPVVDIKTSEDVTVEDCDLNGSGTEGISAESSTNLHIRGNHVHHCTGSGISLSQVNTSEVSGNLIESNPVGIALASVSGVDVASNTVALNASGGIEINASRSVSVTGNIIAFNAAGGGRSAAGVIEGPDSEVEYGANCVYGNKNSESPSDFNGVSEAAMSIQVQSDPNFADAQSGDFTLKPGSPCRGMGHASLLSLDRLAQLPQLSAEEQTRLSGSLSWDKSRRQASRQLPHAATGEMGGQGFGNAALLARQLIRIDIKNYAGDKPEPPTLIQGKYERTVDFEARVAKEKESYRLAAREYSTKIENYPAWRRNFFLETALNAAFGPPKVANTSYDPDGQIFSAEIVSQSPWAKDVKETLALRELIANDQAPEFDEALRQAEPSLRFTLSGPALSLASAELLVGGTVYAALATGVQFSSKPLSADIADLLQGEHAGKTPELTIHYTRSPELEKEYQKLKELSRKKAQRSELDALKKQIAALEAGEQALRASDVDKPEYKLPENPANFAVVVGIEKYPNLPAAQYASRDADAVRAHLKALGYPVRNIMFIANSEATRATLAKALNSWLVNRVKEDSTVFFYYSGHGAPDPQSNSAYLVPADGDPEALPDTAYPVHQLYSKLQELKAQRVIVALDACFSGAGGRSVLAKDARPLVNKIDMGELQPGKIVALSAAKAEQISGAVEEQGHGAFTYYFLKGLSGDAADKDGAVTVQSLYEYLSPKVQDAARLHNRDQNPVMQGAPADAAFRLR